MSHSDQRGLAAELAVGIARRLTITCGWMADAGGLVRHGFQSPFDEACLLLWELGAASAAPDNGRGGVGWEDGKSDANYESFKLLPSDQIRFRLHDNAEVSELVLRRLLTAYVGLACEYGPDILPATRRPFCPPAEYDIEIDALLKSGYLERTGERVCWTDAIGFAMRDRHLWGEDLQPPMPATLQVSAAAIRKVQELLAADQKIAAVNILRREADATLSDALSWIEQFNQAGPALNTRH